LSAANADVSPSASDATSVRARTDPIMGRLLQRRTRAACFAKMMRET
jgi:hypothetical protein